jgi:hypothetical protein
VESTHWTRELAASWTRRSVELDARIRDLHERNAELSAGFGPPDLEERRVAGSTQDHVAKARAAAVMANMRAQEAIRRTAMMRHHAASAHERAAQLHETLAEANSGDVQEHRDQAAMHRQLAREDRAAADATGRSWHGQPPESGHG